MAVIEVNHTFPAITRPTIQTALGPLAVRVQSINYDVNVEGLEQEDGSEAFAVSIAK
jgi:hypothetical protein